ncbi:hypothetical protein GQ600_9627 [Phytophthora cactorum]|nr:hypothetical protein GQ600_9627 [Phytophthora cactorum]
MRVYLILFLAVATLLTTSNAASAPTAKLQTSRHLLQSTDTDYKGFSSGRSLRTEATHHQSIDPDDDERAMITDLVKKLGASTSKWYKDKILTTKLLLEATQMDLDKSAQKLVAQNVDPDRVYTLLKLQRIATSLLAKVNST